MTKKDAQQILNDAGWPIKVDGNWGKWSKRALKDACRAFNFSKSRAGFRRPTVGGRLTRRRQRLLAFVAANDYRCSANFRYAEFRCKGVTRGMAGPEDNWIRVSRALVKRLELYRRNFGPTTIISACRSTAYNKAVGGASLSQHRYSFLPRLVTYAADIAPRVPLTKVRKVWGVGGIGYNDSTGLVSHVDTRPWVSTWSYPR